MLLREVVVIPRFPAIPESPVQYDGSVYQQLFEEGKMVWSDRRCGDRGEVRLDRKLYWKALDSGIK
jgi:hypothetical protein